MGGMDDERASLTAALFLATVAFVSIVVGIACGEARTLMEQAGHIQRQQDKAFRQAHTSASSLGMTIASRCRLVVPKADDEETDF